MMITTATTTAQQENKPQLISSHINMSELKYKIRHRSLPGRLPTAPPRLPATAEGRGEEEEEEVEVLKFFDEEEEEEQGSTMFRSQSEPARPDQPAPLVPRRPTLPSIPPSIMVDIKF